MTRLSRKTVLSAATAVAATVLTLTVASPASAAVPQGRAVVMLHANAQHRVAAPATLQPGLVHVRNTGRRPILIFAKKSEGVGAFIGDMNGSQNTPARLFRDFDFVAMFTPRSDAYTYLGRGAYYLVDATANRYGPARVHTTDVTGTRRDARRPVAARLTVARGGSLTGTPFARHHGYLRMVNDSNSPRLLFMLGIERSATRPQLRAVLAHPSYDGMGALTGRYFAFPTLVGAHHTVTVHLVAPDSRYFVLAQGLFSNDRLRPGDVRVLTLGKAA